MSDHQPNGKALLRQALSTTRRHRQTLSDLELDWPDSRGLLERFAASLHQLRLAPEQERRLLRACVQSGLTGYRLARRECAPDRDRFAAFVNGVSDACTDRTQRALLARALSERQRRHLADRLKASPGHA